MKYWPDLRYIFTLVIFCISLPSFSINCLGVTKMNLKVIFLECTEPSLAWSLFKFVFLHNSIWTRWNCDPSNVFFFRFLPGFSTSSSSSSLPPDSKAWKKHNFYKILQKNSSNQNMQFHKTYGNDQWILNHYREFWYESYAIIQITLCNK